MCVNDVFNPLYATAPVVHAGALVLFAHTSLYDARPLPLSDAGVHDNATIP